MAILVEIAPGELLDKLSILEIKAERIADAAKRANVEVERAILEDARIRHVPTSAGIDALYAELKAVNLAIWEIEDDIREEEREKRFGERFIELARAVYVTNDRRAAIKRRINVALDSAIVEEKSYASY